MENQRKSERYLLNKRISVHYTFKGKSYEARGLLQDISVTGVAFIVAEALPLFHACFICIRRSQDNLYDFSVHIGNAEGFRKLSEDPGNILIKCRPRRFAEDEFKGRKVFNIGLEFGKRGAPDEDFLGLIKDMQEGLNRRWLLKIGEVDV